MSTLATLSPSLTLRRFVDEFYIVERPVGKSGVSQLRDMVRVVNQFARRELTLGDLNENLISQWVPWLEDRYASETCKGKRRQLLGVWRYAADLDAIPEPKPRRVRKVRKPAPLVECWTMEDVAKLIDAVPLVMGRDRFAKMSSNQSSVWYDNNLTATYYRGVDPVKLWVCFIRVALDSGLRLGDVMHIRKADIGADGVMTIRQAKTGNPVLCQLSPEAMQAIAETFGPDREYIFPGWRTWRQKFHKRFKAIVKAAGIRPGTAKWLRRTRATYAEKSTPGMARVVLGHTSSDTWRRYFDVRVGQAPPPMAPRIATKIEAPAVDPDAWTTNELCQLRSVLSLRRFDRVSCGVHIGTFVAGMIGLAYDSALPFAEAVALRWGDVRPDGRVALPNSDQQLVTTVGLTAATWESLAAIRRDGDDRLLAWPGTREAMRDWLIRAIDDAGLRRGNCPFHQLQKTALSHIAEAFQQDDVAKRITGPTEDEQQ